MNDKNSIYRDNILNNLRFEGKRCSIAMHLSKGLCGKWGVYKLSLIVRTIFTRGHNYLYTLKLYDKIVGYCIITENYLHKYNFLNYSNMNNSKGGGADKALLHRK